MTLKKESAGGCDTTTADTNTNTQTLAPRIAEQAAQTIEGRAYAAAYMDRLEAGTARPGDLAAMLSFQDGEMLNGACRLIEKALEGWHHA